MKSMHNSHGLLRSSSRSLSIIPWIGSSSQRSSFHIPMSSYSASHRLLSSSSSALLSAPALLSQKYSSQNEAKELLQKLNDEILKHDELYYNKAEPIIEDEVYDRLLQRAHEIVKKYPRLLPLFTKSETVGSAIATSKSQDVAAYIHNFPMLSLDNTFDHQGVKKFITDIQSQCDKNSDQQTQTSLNFTFEPKIDGVSLSIRYLNGKLISAGTRGDGKVGEDVTRHVRSILNIPDRISLPPKLSSIQCDANVEIEIRGEVYMTDQDFEDAQKRSVGHGNKQFSTPRNTVAGTLRSLDPQVAAKRKMRFIAYGMYFRSPGNDFWDPKPLRECSSLSFQLPKQSDALNLLTEIGFTVPTGWSCLSVPFLEAGFEIMFRQCELYEKNRSKLGYDTDGVVIKVDDVIIQEQLGFRQRSPKWAIAFKFAPKSAITKLLNIEVQVGRTGILTPVAILSPVQIGGVNVERATLHNQQEINRLGIRPGQSVRVQRSGDVIPKVVEGIPDDTANIEPFKFPTHCPVCNSPVVVIPSTNNESSQTHKCSGGYRCQAQVVEKLRHYCSKGAANIKGLAGATLEFLVESGLVMYPSDLYLLQEQQAALELNSTSLDTPPVLLKASKGWGPVSIRNLYSSIENSRSIDCARLIYALGIPQIGQQTAKDIAEAFNDDFLNFWNYIKSEADASDRAGQHEVAKKISSIQGIGPVTIDSLLKFASLQQGSALNPFRADVDKLISQLQLQQQISPPEQSNKVVAIGSSFLSGRHVVFSGKLSTMTRTEAIALIERNGGKVDKQVTAKTNLIIIPSHEELTTTKIKKAIEKGIEIWTEKEWQDRLDQI